LYQTYWYRNSQWTQVLMLLQKSLYAEEMVCAMSSQLFHIPKTKDLKGNKEMHSHLVPASYHRVTAVGSAQRLHNGEKQSSIVKTLTECIKNAEKQDKNVREGLEVMKENAPTEFQSFMKVIIQWQNQAETYLAQSKSMVQSMGFQISNEQDQQSEEEATTY